MLTFIQTKPNQTKPDRDPQGLGTKPEPNQNQPNPPTRNSCKKGSPSRKSNAQNRDPPPSLASPSKQPRQPGNLGRNVPRNTSPEHGRGRLTRKEFLTFGTRQRKAGWNWVPGAGLVCPFPSLSVGCHFHLTLFTYGCYLIHSCSLCSSCSCSCFCSCFLFVWSCSSFFGYVCAFERGV